MKKAIIVIVTDLGFTLVIVNKDNEAEFPDFRAFARVLLHKLAEDNMSSFSLVLDETLFNQLINDGDVSFLIETKYEETELNHATTFQAEALAFTSEIATIEDGMQDVITSQDQYESTL